MKTNAAVLWDRHQMWEVEEVELDGPKQAEVMVQLVASGLCHSDDHIATGDMPMVLPAVGGHEGAGIVVEVGPGVTDVAEGDPVVFSFIPSCGRCIPCASGMGNMCVLGAALIAGPQLDGTHRFHARGQNLGQMCLLGTFSEYTVVPTSSVVRIDPAIPLDKAALEYWPNGIAASPNATASRRARPAKTMKLQLYERNSKTKLVSAGSSTIGSTQPLPQSPRCITTTCSYVRNLPDAGSSSRYKSTAEPTSAPASQIWPTS